MGLFYPDEREPETQVRKVGFARYREVLEANWKDFIKVGFITLVFLIPFAAGMVYAVLSTSALAALLAGLAGGALAGTGLACMYDIILRRLRDDKNDWWHCWKKAVAQNWRSALLPGMVQCVFLGMAVFVAALMLKGLTPFTWGTAALLLFGAVLSTMLLTIWWVQTVLFEQKVTLQLRYALFFCVCHPGRTLGMALIRVAWWLFLFLFLPWTAFLVPFLGLWYVLFLSVFMVYRDLDKDFRIEEQIREKFPEAFVDEDAIESRYMQQDAEEKEP